MRLLTALSPLLLTAAAAAVLLSPYYPYNPHTQHYSDHHLGFPRPRDDYQLRQLFQDAETRCTLRLWRISRRGELDCEDDDDCTGRYGSGVYCRELQVCKLTKGNVCWLKQPDGGECIGDSACRSGHCDTDLGLCTHRQYGNHDSSHATV